MERREDLDESKKSPWNSKILMGIAMIATGLGLKIWGALETAKDTEDMRQKIMNAIRQSHGRDYGNEQIIDDKTRKRIREILLECRGEEGAAKDNCYDRLGK